MRKSRLLLLIIVMVIASCERGRPDPLPAMADEAALVKDWIGLQLNLVKNTTGVTHVAYSRHFAYTGVALYGALTKVVDPQNRVAPKLKLSVVLPARPADKKLFGPAAANAAIAEMLRFFYTAKNANVFSIDSMEQVYRERFNELPGNFDILESVQFGKNIAAAVIEWSKQDGAVNANVPYTPLGEGYWEPTPPSKAAAAVPGWGDVKTIFEGSTTSLVCPAPPAFSTTAGSPFYQMVKEVHDVSNALTPEQKAIALFWDDAPNGSYLTAFGHWYNILKQVLDIRHVTLLKAAEAYMRLGATMNDAGIYCWKTKFTFNQLRPVTYIRKYMGDTLWNSFIVTPGHPEYLAAHATISSSAAASLEYVFGPHVSFTDHSYDALGMQPRTFSSLAAAGAEAGLSRLYGGIHFRPSIDNGAMMGRKIGARINAILRQD